MEENVPEATMLEKVQAQMRRKFQFYLDQSTVYLKARWCGFSCLLLMYLVRVFTANGWYIVTYGLGIYLLNLFIGFITPQVLVRTRTRTETTTVTLFKRTVPVLVLVNTQTHHLPCFALPCLALYDGRIASHRMARWMVVLKKKYLSNSLFLPFRFVSFRVELRQLTHRRTD